MGWTSTFFPALQAGNVLIDDTGMYIYSPTVAFGNLKESIGIAPSITHSPKGEVILPGDTNYGTIPGPALVALQKTQSGIVAYKATNFNGPWTAEANLGFDATNKIMSLTLAAFASVAGTAANPTDVKTDVWNTISSFGTGFAAGSPAPAYRLYPDNSVRLQGVVDVTGTVAVGNVMFTLPYTFPKAANFNTPNTLSGFAAGKATYSMNTTGSVAVQSTGVSGNLLWLDTGFSSLD